MTDEPDFGTNPFAGPPEPVRPMPEALQAAYQAACNEFREFLPHGVPEGNYDLSFVRDSAFLAAESSAVGPLKPVLPPHLVTEIARGVALAAWCAVTRELVEYEP